MVIRTAEEWRISARFSTLGFAETITGRDLRVAGDKAAMQQLLNILLDNAVEYTPVPGRVKTTGPCSGWPTPASAYCAQRAMKGFTGRVESPHFRSINSLDAYVHRFPRRPPGGDICGQF
jgi:hypothetical protein